MIRQGQQRPLGPWRAAEGAYHRGQGHGSRLLKHAIGFAKEKQFLRITLLTHRGEGQMVEFYRKHGFFLSEMVTMRLLLTSGSGAAK